MRPMGGSEILYHNMIKYVGVDWQSKINLILSITHPDHIDRSKKNVLWQHLYTDQGAAQGMTVPQFTELVDTYVYVSEWQLQQFVEHFSAGIYHNTVIKNAIEPIPFITKPTDKIRLVYSSMPDRGLEVLLDAWQILNPKDVELVVYSSNIIYGKGYSDSRKGLYDHLFHRAKTTPGIIYKGYAMNQAVRKMLQQSHILAYPSIFPETSCMSAIEAGAAGCKIITTDFGALPETCNGWAELVPYCADHKQLAENFAQVLKSAIDNYETTSYNIKDQSDWFNEYYSWQNRSQEWKNLFNQL